MENERSHIIDEIDTHYPLYVWWQRILFGACCLVAIVAFILLVVSRWV